jgi:hypothetical protein
LQFPYPAPQSNEPTKTLKALINIRKESLKFVKILPAPQVDPEEIDSPTQESNGVPGVPPPPPVPKKPITNYTIEFIFDCDCRCEITIMYFCTEEITSNGV